MIGKNHINPIKQVLRMPIIQIKTMIQSKKNTQPGKVNFFFVLIYFFLINQSFLLIAAENNDAKFVDIKVLDKVSSKTDLLKLEIGEELNFKSLSIKSLKCKNSEFDDNPEITAYLQVKDLTNKDNNEVFVFNGWTFSSSPAVNPFDHPVYDIWLSKCY